MRITFVLPALTLHGGVRVVALQAHHLAQRGHRVVVVAASPIVPLVSKVRQLLRTRRWPRLPGPDCHHFSGADADVRLLDPGESLLRSAKVPRADVIVATWWETAEWVASLPADRGAKAYYVQGHETHAFLPEMRVRATYQLRMHKIVVSNWLVDIMRREYGDSDVSLALNAVDTEHFDAPPRTRSRVPTAGFIYSLAAAKGVDVIVDAIRKARASIPNLRVIAFGACQPSRHLPLPTSTEYHFQPAQSDIPKLYLRCDAWLFGGRSEGFGLPVLEAMACRTPVVGTRAGAAPELLAEGRGRLVDVDDSASMARQLVEILRVPHEQWEQMSSDCRAEAERHDWPSCTSAFEAGLMRALERAGRLGDIAQGNDA